MNKPEFNPELLEKAYMLFAENAEKFAQLETELLSVKSPMHAEAESFKDNPFGKSKEEYIDMFKKNNELFEKIVNTLDIMISLVEGTSELVDYTLSDDAIVLRVYLVQMMKEDNLDFEDYFTDLKMKRQMYMTQRNTNEHLINELMEKPN